MDQILEISGLGKTYHKGKHEIPALPDVSCSLGEGKFLSIVGRSGSGKSTLLNLVGGSISPVPGRSFSGERIWQPCPGMNWPCTGVFPSG